VVCASLGGGGVASRAFRPSLKAYRASMLSRSTSARDARDEIGQRAIFWCDVHFLMIAVKHLGGVLKLLGGAPGLDKGSKAKALRAGCA
jgi:hypothetical protein